MIPTDSTIIVASIAAIPPTIAAVASIWVSWRNSDKLDDIHITLNSRLTQLLQQTSMASRAAGKVEGVAQEQAKGST